MLLVHHILGIVKAGVAAEHVGIGLFAGQQQPFLAVAYLAKQACIAGLLVILAAGTGDQPTTALQLDAAFKLGQSADFGGRGQCVDIDRLLLEGTVIFKERKLGLHIAATAGARRFSGGVGIPVQCGCRGRHQRAGCAPCGNRRSTWDFLAVPFVAAGTAAPFRFAGCGNLRFTSS